MQDTLNKMIAIYKNNQKIVNRKSTVLDGEVILIILADVVVAGILYAVYKFVLNFETISQGYQVLGVFGSLFGVAFSLVGLLMTCHFFEEIVIEIGDLWKVSFGGIICNIKKFFYDKNAYKVKALIERDYEKMYLAASRHHQLNNLKSLMDGLDITGKNHSDYFLYKETLKILKNLAQDKVDSPYKDVSFADMEQNLKKRKEEVKDNSDIKFFEKTTGV